MSRDFPDRINPWSAAEGRRIYEGTVPLERMARLRELLARQQGEASFRAAFSLDGERRPVIELDVSAALPLTCQASLETYSEPVARQTLLGVVASPEEYGLLPPHYEPVLAQDGHVALADLVEDELLLGLPQVPRRPDLATVAWSSKSKTPADDAAPGQTGVRRPFAALGALLADRDEPGEPE